jgi:hypothetical protein
VGAVPESAARRADAGISIEERQSALGGVVKDDPDGVPQTGTHTAHAVT